GRTYSPPASGRRYCLTAAVRSPRGTLQRAHVLLVAPKLGAVKGPASVLPASVLYGGQEGLKSLSFKMCAFQGEKPLTNRLLLSSFAEVSGSGQSFVEERVEHDRNDNRYTSGRNRSRSLTSYVNQYRADSVAEDDTFQ